MYFPCVLSFVFQRMEKIIWIFQQLFFTALQKRGFIQLEETKTPQRATPRRGFPPLHFKSCDQSRGRVNFGTEPEDEGRNFFFPKWSLYDKLNYCRKKNAQANIKIQQRWTRFSKAPITCSAPAINVQSVFRSFSV